MTLARRLLRGAAGAALPTFMVGMFNGRSVLASYKIGAMSSDDGGATWTRYAGNPVIAPAAGWESDFVVDPSINWDGTQYVLHYAGFDGTSFRIGRATSPDGLTWTKDAGNPVFGLGAAGNFDDTSVNFPTVLYDVAAVHPWQMWYTGWPDISGNGIAIGYAYSADGISWTRVARVLDVGGLGAFDHLGLATGPVLRIGTTYYVYYTGWDGSHYHTGYATSTDPTSAGAYTKQGVIAAFAGNVALSGGITCQSNQLRSLNAYGSIYRGLVTCFHPTDATNREFFAATTTTDLATFSAPAGPTLALGASGQWDDKSLENPVVIRRV